MSIFVPTHATTTVASHGASNVSFVSSTTSYRCVPQLAKVPSTTMPQRRTVTAVSTASAVNPSSLTPCMPAHARAAPQAFQVPSLPASPSVPLLPHQLASMPIAFRKGEGGRVKRILCYGDSLTAGFCSGGFQFVPYGRTMIEAIAEAGIQGEVSICGHSGATAKEMLASSESTIVDVVGGRGKGLARILKEEAAFDFVLIMAGTNDRGHNRSQTDILKDLRSLHEICHEHGTPTVALAPPPVPAETPAREIERLRFVASLESLCAEMDGVIACVDPAQFVPLERGTFWETDGLHFSPGGSHALGRGLATLALRHFSENEQEPDSIISAGIAAIDALGQSLMQRLSSEHYSMIPMIKRTQGFTGVGYILSH